MYLLHKKQPGLRLLSLTLLVSLWLCLSGCPRLNPEPKGYELVVSVVDQTGKPVPGADITLYRLEEDFRRNENPVQLSRKTDANGKLLLVGLPFDAGQFYVSAEYGNANNWDATERRTGLLEAERTNEFKTTIRESLANIIAGRNSKRWRQTFYRVNQTEFSDCTRRQIFRFIRSNFTIEVRDCNDKPLGFNFWRVTSDNTAITLGPITSPPSPSTYTVTFTELSDKKMRYFHRPANGVLVTEEFEAVP